MGGVAALWALGTLAGHFGMPASHIVIALAAGSCVAATRRHQLVLPPGINNHVSSLVGVIMGGYLSSAPANGGGTAGLLVLVVAMTGLVVSLVMGYVVHRWARIELATGVLGMVAGGSSAAVAASAGAGADKSAVAFMQYFRVLLVASTVPIFALCADAGHDRSPQPQSFRIALVERGDQLAGLSTLVVLCLVGGNCARRLHFPSPALFGPMILAAMACVFHISHGFLPAATLQQAVLTLVGLDAGLGMHRSALRAMKKTWLIAVISTVFLCGTTTALAEVAARHTKYSFLDVYLATTPGGINAVIGGASTLGADMSLVSAVQAARLLIVGILIAGLVLTLSFRQKRRAQSTGSSETIL